MKFSKSLSSVAEETLPEWKDKFLQYKDLKKQLNLMYPNDDNDKADGGDGAPVNKRPEEMGVAKEVIDFVTVLLFKRNFVRKLEEEMEKFNLFIEDKEEDFIIKWKELQDRVGKAKNSHEELMRVGREVVDFHGEMVLLENYCALNYTGLLKILKKYDKKSGELIRLAFIHKIMQQPFFTTQVLNQLVKECETMLDQLFTRNESSDSRETANRRSDGSDYKGLMESTEQQLRFHEELCENENMDSMYVKLTRSALRALKEIRSGSSTVNMFSLPPFPINAM